MRILIFLSLTLISVCSLAQASKDTIDFSITFSSCFEDDFVELSLDGVKIFNNVKVKTIDRVISISNVGVYQNSKGLWVTIDKTTKKSKRLSNSDTLNCDILFNNRLQKFRIALNRGNNIFIDNCDFKNGVARGLTVHQYRGTVYLD